MRSLSPAERQARQRNLLYLTQPKRWTTWPFLPVVRRRPGQEEEYGVLFDAKTCCGLLGYSSTVFVCNYFQLPQTLDQFLALPKEVFDNGEELADAGWSVD